MADQLMPAPAPGAGTSEYTVTKWIMFLGFAISFLGVALQVVQAAGALPGAPPWLPIVTIALGGIISTLKAIVYSQGRANVKIASYDGAAAAADLAKRAGAPPAAGFISLVLMMVVTVVTIVAVLFAPFVARAQDEAPVVVSTQAAPATVGRVTWRFQDETVTGVWMREDAASKLDASLRQCEADRDAATLKAVQSSIPASWWIGGAAVLAAAAFGLGYKLGPGSK